MEAAEFILYFVFVFNFYAKHCSKIDELNLKIIINPCIIIYSWICDKNIAVLNFHFINDVFD